MKRTAKTTRFKLPETARNALLTIACLAIFDVIVAFSGASYLSGNIGAFLGKSRAVILSDLLFIEGVIIFAVGSFLAFAMAAKKKEPSSNPSAETTDKSEQPQKRINIGTLMMIMGAILIGLSIAVGTLLI